MLFADEDLGPVAHYAFLLLLMIYGSMRFDDAMRVSPATVHLRADAIRCEAWQTKVERKRK
eukprot:6104953-Amphidinium_carterae.1